jgi:hypothetical protein
MRKAWIILVALAFAGAAHAQYRWVDKDGKTRYGDTPPPGVKATALGAPASGAAPAPAPAAGSKDAKKGPLTAAEREQDYRKRQEAAKKEQEKSDKGQKVAAEKAENCTRAREYKVTLDSGRVARTNAAGERYYMDEDQIAQELAKAQQTIAQFCN